MNRYVYIYMYIYIYSWCGVIGRQWLQGDGDRAAEGGHRGPHASREVCLRTFFFLSITLEPRVGSCNNLWALNTSPPQNWFAIMRGNCSVRGLPLPHLTHFFVNPGWIIFVAPKVDEFIPHTRGINFWHHAVGIAQPQEGVEACIQGRGTSLIRKCLLLGPCSRTMPRALRWSYGGGGFLWARYPCTPREVTPPRQLRRGFRLSGWNLPKIRDLTRRSL